MPRKVTQRRVCFVTGTRAEFGLMRSTLEAIREHPNLKLQIIATGSHLSKQHGETLQTIKAGGWKVDAAIPWKSGSEARNAVETGRVMAKLAAWFEKLNTDILLVVGDRVEAFAAAAAGHISGKIVAHIHGGDRALGQVDDALRHAITKLAHLHFPATAKSAERLIKLGEDRWRVHRVGSPGIDQIVTTASKRTVKGGLALVVLHPTEADENREFSRAKMVLKAVQAVGFERIVIVYPNNDPGCGGIIRCWRDSGEMVFPDIERSVFLGLLRDATVLVGNSSSGIIEAASFGTPVIDIGPRQEGRERSGNVTNIAFSEAAIHRELARIWNGGAPIRFPRKNVYGGGGAGKKIAQRLARVQIDGDLKRKLIVY
jgi:GDP/UDP-N,N'-diacetylbacillosamine 2-epimerase (hydrolysing)